MEHCHPVPHSAAAPPLAPCTPPPPAPRASGPVWPAPSLQPHKPSTPRCSQCVPMRPPHPCHSTPCCRQLPETPGGGEGGGGACTQWQPPTPSSMQHALPPSPSLPAVVGGQKAVAAAGWGMVAAVREGGTATRNPPFPFLLPSLSPHCLPACCWGGAVQWLSHPLCL